MRGRRPQSTAHKLAAGTRKSRINQNEPQPSGTMPEPPEWLDDAARAKWDELAPELHRTGVLTVIDGDTLATFCTAWAELEWATKDIQKNGRTYQTLEGETKASPSVAMQRSAWKGVKDFAALLGLDPSSRSRLKVAPPEIPDDADPLKLFSGDPIAKYL
jgi:P27 family predicted phage terminase small subunit